MFQILRNDVIDNINKFNLVNVFASIKCLNTKNRTSNFFQITCPGTSSTFTTQKDVVILDSSIILPLIALLVLTRGDNYHTEGCCNTRQFHYSAIDSFTCLNKGR
jgi:hypothetical protein